MRAFLATTILFCFLSAAVAAGMRLPDLSLRDQYDKPFNLRQWEGRALVLIASDKEGKIQNQDWQKAIRHRYGDRVVMLGVADVRSVPFFLKDRIKRDFQKDPDAVFLDWDGALFVALGLKPHVSNVILVDRQGFVRSVHSGPASGSTKGLFSAIDAVL